MNFNLKRNSRSLVKLIFIPGIIVSSLTMFTFFIPIEGPIRTKFLS